MNDYIELSQLVSLDDLKKLMSEGKIVDAKTVYAITFWENMLLTSAQDTKEKDG